MARTTRQARIEVSAGAPYGHVPGHHYHDVDVSCEADGSGSGAEAIETWGSCQGLYSEEEHGCQEIAARDLGGLMRAAIDADWSADARGYLSTAITRAYRAIRERRRTEDECA